MTQNRDGIGADGGIKPPENRVNPHDRLVGGQFDGSGDLNFIGAVNDTREVHDPVGDFASIRASVKPGWRRPAAFPIRLRRGP